MMTAPVTAAATIPGGNSPHLEYLVNLADTGLVQVQSYISPSIDFTNSGGLKFAISFDDEAPQIINLHADKSGKAWEKSVADNVFTIVSKHQIKKPGAHTLKFWRVDAGVVLQKLVINTAGIKESYLGAPESFYKSGLKSRYLK